MVNSSFWKGKKVLITGHTGFKGSWLTKWLLMNGAEICGISLEQSNDQAIFHQIKLEEEIQHHICDINNLEKTNKIFEEFKPEIIFHLAAQPLVRKSYIQPIETFQTNVIGTANVLECARNTDSVKSLVIITTDKCYENKEWVYGYRENDSLGGYDPYSASKACAELVVSSYRNSFFNLGKYNLDHSVLVATARAGNVIGGGDWSEDRLIPDCFRSIFSGKPIVIRNPNAVRPWQHVLEPLYGYQLLAKRMYEGDVAVSGAWNFGPNHDSVVCVGDIVKSIVNIWGSGVIENGDSIGPHEANLLMLDISKARSILEWKPVMKINTAMRLIVDWYKAPAKEKIAVTENQINQFIKKIPNYGE